MHTFSSGPSVAVIVPGYDVAPYLGDALASVRAQDRPDWECIVVDDGSTDDTAAVAQRFVDDDPRFRLLRQDNAGAAVARNTALAQVSDGVGLIAFLDGDDVWEPDALSLLIAALDADDAAVGVYGLAEYIDSDGTPILAGVHPAAQRDRRVMGAFDLTSVPVAAPSTFSTLVVSGTIWPSAVGLHRRDAVEQAGRFDPQLRKAQDWDLYLRMSRFGHFVPVDRRVAWYRRREQQATSSANAEAIAYALATVRHKSWTSAVNDRVQRREVRTVWRRLAARWTVWTMQAVLHGVRTGRPRETYEALLATGYFAALAAAGRPARPSRRLARLTVRYVSARAVGAGGSPP